VVNDEYYDFSFVYYLLRNSKDYFLTFNAGIVTPIVPKSTFSKIKVFVPKSKTTQQKIARILSAYDDLIENNLKRIKLLEEMAQITYEEWFVRMKFPGHENTPVDAETGLPEGWHEKPLETLATFLNGFAFKPDQLGDSGLPVIKIKELKGGVVGDTPRNSGAEIPDKYIVNTGDILFSWSGSLEVVLWQYEKGLLNQHLFKVKPNSDIPSSFMYLSLASCLPFFENLTTGATMKHIKRKELSFVKAIVPDCKLLKEFDQQVSPILKSILNLNEQNQKLKEARDILLPRLMTGMIDVDQLEFPDIEVNEARNCC
jgi:type I restriction enzyme S subunit